jgi:molybdate transport system substrate-binding protein
MRNVRLLLVLVALLAKPAGAGELLVAAAVSLSEPLGTIAARFEKEHPGTHVQLAFGASSALAAQAKAGAPMDVFVAADEETIAALASAGLVRKGTQQVIAGNTLVVIASQGLRVPIESAADLARPEVRRIALPEAAVPLGHYGREWLTARGLLATLAPRLVATEHARATLAAVDAGNADAGIVYATDARMARSARVAYTPPAAEQPRIVYVAALLTSAREPGLANRFLVALMAIDARRDLLAAGFAPPPGIASR